MDSQRGQIRKGWLECQGTGFVQQSQSRETWIESTSTRGRQTPRLFLRPYGRHEEEADQREDGQRSELTHQQKPSGWGRFKFMPCAFAEARPLAFKPPSGFLPSFLCHAGLLAIKHRCCYRTTNTYKHTVLAKYAFTGD